MDSEEYRRKIEEDILRVIEEKLVAQKINADRAKHIAQLVLSSLYPHMSLNQIHDVVQQFDDNFSELIPIVHEVNSDYDEKVKKVVSNHAQKLIAQRKIDESLDIVRKAINNQVILPDSE